LDSVGYCEIPAENLTRAEEFYSRAFGWAMDRIPEKDYIVMTTTPSDEKGKPTQTGSINGGLAKLRNGPHYPIITIRVDDIDSSLKNIEKLGGKTVGRKSLVSNIGFRAYFEDTEGNVVGLLQELEF